MRSISDVGSGEDRLPEARRLRLVRCGKLALAVSAAALLTFAATWPEDAAACRGAGVTTRNNDGSFLTKWSDGAYVKKNTDGSTEWAYPSGTEPVPGASPGHKPR